MPGSSGARCVQNPAAQPIVDEFPLRAGALAQCAELRHARVQRGDLSALGGEDLAPVGAGSERRQGGLDLGYDGLHLGRAPAPREVDRERVAALVRAQPQPVGGDRAQLGDEQERDDRIGEPAHRLDRCNSVVAGDEELGLELLARAGGEPGARVR